MHLNNFEEKLHSIKLLQITVVACFYFFIVEKIDFDLPAIVISWAIFVWAGLSFVKSVKIIMLSLLFALSFFVVVLIFPSKDYDHLTKIHFLYWEISKKLFDQQLLVLVRIACISSVSVMSAYLVNYEKVFIYLMKNKILGVRFGYPMILAFNSLGGLKSELEKININARFRRIPFLKRVNLLFPLLVYSIRHAERGAMSLVTRGMSEDKSFYFDVALTKRDNEISYFFIAIHLALVGFYFYTVK